VSEDIPYVDRRVLGAGTTLRFTLLVVLITSICIDLITSTVGLAPGEAQERSAALPWVWGMAGTAAVLGLAFLTYWWLPRWKIRRGRLIPVRDDELAAELLRLAERAGLARQPRFVMDWAAATPSAVVFGRWRHVVVSLHGGLVALRPNNSQGFADVVLHELAHIRNRDVDIAYATEALWRVFAVFVLLPYTVISIYPAPWRLSPAEAFKEWQGHWQWGLHGLARIAVYVVLILLTRADVLRTRELYADLDAARWSGSRRPLSPHPADGPDKVRLRGGLQRFNAVWRTHPSWTERRESLVAPGPLFGVRALTMFLTGVTVMTAVDALGILPHASLRTSAGVLGGPATWVMAILVTGIVGIAVWRAVAHAVLTNQPAPSGLHAGLWLGLGLAVGELVSFHAAVGGLLFAPLPRTPPWLPPAPHLLLLLVAAVAVLTWWATQCAELWVRTCRGRTLLGISLVGLSVLLVVFGAWFEWWNAGGYLYMIGAARNTLRESGVAATLSEMFPGTSEQGEALLPFVPAEVFVVTLMQRPMVMVGGALLWLFPLAAWARRPVEGVPGWVRRAHPAPDGWTMAGSHLPRLRWVLTRGVEGAALCVCAVMGTRLWLHLSQPPSGQRSAKWLFYTMVWTTLALVCAAAVVSAAVSASASRYRLPVALSAAGTALLGGLAGTFALAATDGCVPPLETAASVCGWKHVPAWVMVHQVIGPFTLGAGLYAVTIAIPAGVGGRFLVERGGLVNRLAGWRARSSQAAAGVKRLSPGRTLALGAVGGMGCVAAVAGTRAWLHTNRLSPDQSFLARVEDSTLWMTLALVVAAALTTAAAGALTRWYAPTAALAGVTALLLGLIGIFILMTTDGCVPGAEVLASTCQWRPAPAWRLFINTVVPCVLALGTCVTAALILGGLTRWRAPVERPLSGRIAGRIAGRTYVGTACVITGVLLAGWWGLTVRTADRAVAELPVSCPAGSQDPCHDLARRQIQLWASTGAVALLDGFQRDYTTFGADLLESARMGGEINEDTYRPLCEKWRENGRRAKNLPPPEPEASKLWNQVAEGVKRGGETCLKGLERRDGELLGRGFGEISGTHEEYVRLLERLTFLASD